MSDSENQKVGAYQWYKDLPPWAKGTAVVGVGFVLTLLGFWAVKYFRDKAAAKKAEQDLKVFKGDLDDLGKKGINPTYPESQYRQWADAIGEAFTGCDFSFAHLGANYNTETFYSDAGKAVFRIVNQLKNDADFLALQVAYGKPTISKHWYCGGDIVGRTLAGAINNMLEGAEVQALNHVLKDNHITYTF